jgi:hypothetical protein
MIPKLSCCTNLCITVALMQDAEEADAEENGGAGDEEEEEEDTDEQ